MSAQEPLGIGPVASPGQSRPRAPKLSQILGDIASDPTRIRISVGDLLAIMGDRAFGALLLVFALPNALPTPPGTSGILGIPLLFLSAQLMLGRSPWLPRWIAGRSIDRADFAALVERAHPWLSRAERMVRPRLVFLAQSAVEGLIGAICLILAIVLVLPIPLGNMLPAFAICLFALGILERDGTWIVAGAIMSLLALALVAGVFYALVKGAIFVITNALTR